MSKHSTASLCELKFMGIPAPIFTVFALILWVSVGLNLMAPTTLSLWAFLVSIAMPLTWIGKNTPFLGKYLGFGALLTLFGPSLLVTIGYINADMQASIKSFSNDVLIPLNIGLLLCGSMLGKVDRNSLKRAIIRYLPVIILSMAGTVAVTAAVGALLGYNIFDSVVVTAFPCFAGGTGGAMINVPQILNDFGYNGDSFVGMMVAALTLSNILAIIFCAILDTIGKLRPSWTGNGDLICSGKAMDAGQETATFDGKLASLQEGLLTAGILFAISTIIAAILKPVINLNYVVWLIVLCMILKLTHILPDHMENSVAWASDFIVGVVLPALMVGIGISTIDLVGTIASLTPRFFIMVTTVVVAYVVFSMLFGRLFGFFPVESGISVGCCSCNLGGTGDLICCEVSKRLTLYPFASISTRIGGAIALIALSFVLQFID